MNFHNTIRTVLYIFKYIFSVNFPLVLLYPNSHIIPEVPFATGTGEARECWGPHSAPGEPAWWERWGAAPFEPAPQDEWRTQCKIVCHSWQAAAGWVVFSASWSKFRFFFPFLSFSFFPLSFFGCGSWVYVDIVTLDYLHIANMRSFVIRSVMALSLGYHWNCLHYGYCRKASRDF